MQNCKTKIGWAFLPHELWTLLSVFKEVCCCLNGDDGFSVKDGLLVIPDNAFQKGLKCNGFTVDEKFQNWSHDSNEITIENDSILT